MAFKTAKVAEKARQEEKKDEKGRKPDYIARCKQSPDSDFYLTIGAAWITEVNGKQAISLKLNSLPVDFNGSVLLMEPLESKE